MSARLGGWYPGAMDAATIGRHAPVSRVTPEKSVADSPIRGITVLLLGLDNTARNPKERRWPVSQNKQTEISGLIAPIDPRQ
jgi:hypothetical protein